MATSNIRGSVSLGSHGHEEYFEYFCQPCGKDGNHLEAEGYCTDCGEFLCQECYRIHRKPTALQHHVLLRGSSMKQYGPPSAGRETPSDQCDQHRGKVIEYFCTVHKQSGCTACLMMNHRTCDPVLFIPDEAQTITDSQEYKSLKQTLDALNNNATDVKARFVGKSSAADAVCDNAVADFDNFRKDVNKAMDDCKKELLEVAHSIRDADKERMRSKIASADDTAKEIQKFQSELQQLETTRKFSRLFIATKKANEKVQALKTALVNVENDGNVTQYTFVPNKQAQQLLGTSQGMGSIRQESNTAQSSQPVDVHSATRGKVTDSPATKPSAPGNIYQPQPEKSLRQIGTAHVEDINMRSSTNPYIPVITGLTGTGDSLVVIDNNCRKVKLVSLETKNISDELDTGEEPFDVEEIDPGQVVVTIPDARKIWFLNVTKTKLSKAKEIDVSGRCHGIARYGKKLAITFINPRKVALFSINGVSLVVINEGLPLKVPYYVVFGLDGQSVYVSDDSTHTVTHFSLNGTILGEYKDKDLRGPHQIALDSSGNIYVCGRTSLDLRVVGPDLKAGRVLMEHPDGIMSPRAIFLCSRTNKLYIGVGNGMVKVVQLV